MKPTASTTPSLTTAPADDFARLLDDVLNKVPTGPAELVPVKSNALAEAKKKALLDQAQKAVKLLGAVVSPKIYAEVEGIWFNRLALWFARGDCVLEDVAAACESLSTPAALSRVEFASEFNSELAGAIHKISTQRKELERQAKQRAADMAPQSIAEHAEARKMLDKMLAGIGEQVGPGRTTNPRGSTDGKGQDPEPTPGQVAEAEDDRKARAKKGAR